MIENIKDAFKCCKALIFDFFSMVNYEIEHDNLFDAFIALLLGGMLFLAIVVLIVLIGLVIIDCPYILLLLIIPLMPIIYIWWKMRQIKKRAMKKHENFNS
jgi:uncharacterized membrane protein YesL